MYVNTLAGPQLSASGRSQPTPAPVAACPQAHPHPVATPREELLVSAPGRIPVLEILTNLL